MFFQSLAFSTSSPSLLSTSLARISWKKIVVLLLFWPMVIYWKALNALYRDGYGFVPRDGMINCIIDYLSAFPKVAANAGMYLLCITINGCWLVLLSYLIVKMLV